jgi:acetoin utilization deacetylase AcuC-like enzyme
MLVCSAHEELDHHDSGPGHPENAERLSAAVSGLREVDPEAIEWLPPRAATLEEMASAHDRDYLDGLKRICEAGGGQIDPDTFVSSGSWDTACLTAGAGLAAVDALRNGQGRAAFVLGRPPGHHATRDHGMGFCLVNNVAVAAATLASAGERVAIFDWDVHHGNGTQDIFWEDPSVLYVSMHQWPLYPGTGRPRERGEGAGKGTTLNLPLPPGTTGGTYLELMDDVVIPTIERFGPTWLLVSAGFDAHRRDPLGDMALTSGDFADLTGRLVGMSGLGGRLLLFLEGGYDPEAVRMSVGACAARLVGQRYRPEPASGDGDTPAGAGRDQAAEPEEREER